MDLEFIQQLAALPINIVLFVVIYFLWGKMETIQTKYEDLLKEVSKLEGAQELEKRIANKLDILLTQNVSKKRRVGSQ